MMMIGMDQPGNVTLQGGLWDAERINYYKSYITELKRAIDDGATVIGYFAWSLLDNFEWRLGYTSRFGLVYVDFKTNIRYLKDSAYWFKYMLKRERNNRCKRIRSHEPTLSRSNADTARRIVAIPGEPLGSWSVFAHNVHEPVVLQLDRQQLRPPVPRPSEKR
ncbi:hypothetical protein GW17_00031341 [Ensete ventricosum]|nr:hypothetical protein GW17_00031341 [Ensete ventricosum]